MIDKRMYHVYIYIFLMPPFFESSVTPLQPIGMYCKKQFAYAFGVKIFVIIETIDFLAK